MATAYHRRADDPEARTCNLHYIRRELGQSCSDRRMVLYLAQLIATEDFPRPLPTLVRGGTITREVHRRSEWLREAVDAWIDGFTPPGAAAQLDRRDRQRAAADMDSSASNLRLVAGRDVHGRRA